MLKQLLKDGKTKRKLAKKAGDSATVKQLSKEMKAKQAKRDSLKKMAGPKKGAVPLIKNP